MNSFTITGKLVDLFSRDIYPASVVVENGIIAAIEKVAECAGQYLLPGFVDAHIHIESSMLVPTAFAPLAVVHGTVATVSDPHEIANVCGAEGVQYMIDNSKQTPFKIFFGAPSCVPATTFETAGATLDAGAVEKLLASGDIWYLSEMMNYPGVLFNDEQVMAKIAAAHKAGKPVDGHAPGLRGEDARKYVAAGITTDHECFTLEEALEKVALGMHILIREGSAARNYEALHELLRLHPGRVMFCSDDKHPDELMVSHIDAIVRRSLAKGYDLYDVLRAASVNPVMHYKLPVGLLRVGDPADFIVADDLDDLRTLQTYISGQKVAEKGQAWIQPIAITPINNFNTNHRIAADFKLVTSNTEANIRVIEALEGQLITNELILPAKVEDGAIVSDTSRDIIKLVVVNRYMPDQPVAIGFIRNTGLRSGALASTVAHDCHNIIAAGVSDGHICAAVNALIDSKGGVAVSSAEEGISVLPLPVAGLMSAEDGYNVGAQYTAIDQKAKALGTTLHAPFMTLSFMALLVIPSLKLSDRGLFSGAAFSFTPVVA